MKKSVITGCINKQNEIRAFFFALGFGGQYIFIWPKEELVIPTASINKGSHLEIIVMMMSQ